MAYKQGEHNIAKRPEIRSKISKALKGRVFSREWKEKISISKKGQNKGSKNVSKRPEVRLKISIANKGKIHKPHTEEWKIKHSLDMQRENNPMWKNGKSFEGYGFEFTEELKTEIRKRFGFQCVICKENGFSVHHIDYNKKNNDISNFAVLCNKCHGKTNHNRDYWIDYFRKTL